ncbi:hypothetical protein ACAX43_12505 [Paraburkholderia sp. IW21]|uniref:hypothetical protein n=1 Tax=Paraburkholderia sp. IW21 TaxID=3242488 RepID=UPI0035207FD6
MHNIFEVTLHLTGYATLKAILKWCAANTSEFDTTSPADNDLDEACFIRNLLDSGTVETRFYFFEETEAMLFKLTFAEYL